MGSTSGGVKLITIQFSGPRLPLHGIPQPGSYCMAACRSSLLALVALVCVKGVPLRCLPQLVLWLRFLKRQRFHSSRRGLDFLRGTSPPTMPDEDMCQVCNEPMIASEELLARVRVMAACRIVSSTHTQQRFKRSDMNFWRLAAFFGPHTRRSKRANMISWRLAALLIPHAHTFQEYGSESLAACRNVIEVDDAWQRVRCIQHRCRSC